MPVVPGAVYDAATLNGRTLEKVRAQTRLPGHLLEVGEEQILLFHHALFRFRVSLIGEEREPLTPSKIGVYSLGMPTALDQGQEVRATWAYHRVARCVRSSALRGVSCGPPGEEEKRRLCPWYREMLDKVWSCGVNRSESRLSG